MTSLKAYKNYLFNLLPLSFVHPSWAFYMVKEEILDRVVEKHVHEARLDDCNRFLSSLEEAIVRITSQSPELVQSKLDNAQTTANSINTETLISPTWSASDVLGKCIYTICRFLKPQVVVETGVALGSTSFCILKALQENQSGHLYSVDLPLSLKAKSDVGRLVPNELRSHWTLKFGPSQYVLPRLFKDLSAVDIFVHDSRYTYRCQSLEYGLAWVRLNDGGVLISDDIENDSFIEFAEAKQVIPIIVPQAKNSPIGILAKQAIQA